MATPPANPLALAHPSLPSPDAEGALAVMRYKAAVFPMLNRHLTARLNWFADNLNTIEIDQIEFVWGYKDHADRYRALLQLALNDLSSVRFLSEVMSKE